jgi:hypothetical protein
VRRKTHAKGGTRPYPALEGTAGVQLSVGSELNRFVFGVQSVQSVQ